MTSKEELTEILEELEEQKARATELITVYVPAGQNIYTVADQLEAEKSTAKNIKSTSTRKNVGNALDKITRQLKEHKKTPENGLAIFCGNVSKVEGQDNLQLWEIEPPMPLKTRMYRCDKEFILDPLKEMMEVTEVFGLLVMDRKEATIGLLEGKRIDVLQKMTSGIPSKVRAGGQCLFENTIVTQKNKGEIRLKEVREGYQLEGLDLKTLKPKFNKCKKKWTIEKEQLLIITDGEYPSSQINASPDHMFYIFHKGKITEKIAIKLHINDLLIGKGKKMIKILSIDRSWKERLIDIEVENKNFFANGILVHNSSQRFHRITEGLTKDFYKRIAEEMKKIFFTMPKLKGILVGGPIPTKDEFLEGEYLTTQLGQKVMGKIDLGDSSESGLRELVERSQELLVNHERLIEKKDVENFFKHLGESPEKSTLGEKDTKKALDMGAVAILYISSKIEKTKARELAKVAGNMGTQIKMISIETPEGEQFFNLGGIGAVLRFAV